MLTRMRELGRLQDELPAAPEPVRASEAAGGHASLPDHVALRPMERGMPLRTFNAFRKNEGPSPGNPDVTNARIGVRRPDPACALPLSLF